MSTFNGLVAEFPDIRVDFFRSHPDLRPPLACFLSHIHSDHLAGLESLRSPFVYCSAATKQMLLRLERYPCRINYATGILEARVQRYRHLRNLLKPIPLATPTVLELEPGNHLQVTLFDANHCPGAVMFLFEGQGKAVLYTGDMRSEPWFVNAIARSPHLIEYSSGLKTLDTIYLDTSFTENVAFPTKAEGISELLRKVSRYPDDTVFHFQAWTYGYEDVLLALSKFLKSKIHVDEYKMSIFRSLVTTHFDDKSAPLNHLAPEAPGLVGFMCGNAHHSGCLTRDESVRLHSCEKGAYCTTIKNSPVVWIRPIITHLPDGHDVAEVGVGGGADDLEREAELDHLSPDDVTSLMNALGNIDGISDDMRESLGQFLHSVIANGRNIPLDMERNAFGENNKADLASGLRSIVEKLRMRGQGAPTESLREDLPSVVTFPYSRHSSYPELRHFVETFKPRDVWPCTVDEPRWIREGITIESLFSECCSGGTFRHDEYMKERYRHSADVILLNAESQITISSAAASQLSSIVEYRPKAYEEPLSVLDSNIPPQAAGSPGLDSQVARAEEGLSQNAAGNGESSCAVLGDSQMSGVSDWAFETRLHAFQAALSNARGHAGGEIRLMSTTDNHSTLDVELGGD
ncbi:beta-lactamase-like protein [Chaetomium sp. MPI-SDFR-AT-0129]|nr:beta-lactamase-like protein [Chaetomium sp. MPI-SDFR-AT-0129]